MHKQKWYDVAIHVAWLIYSPIASAVIAVGGTYAFMMLLHVHKETAIATATLVAATAFIEHMNSERRELRKERLTTRTLLGRPIDQKEYHDGLD